MPSEHSRKEMVKRCIALNCSAQQMWRVTRWRCDGASQARDVSVSVMAGREEALPPGRDPGVDGLEAAISVKHPLNLESSLVLSLFAQKDLGYESFPQRPMGPGILGPTGRLRGQGAGDLLRSAQPSP